MGGGADSNDAEAEVVCRYTMYQMDGTCVRNDKDRLNEKKCGGYFAVFNPIVGLSPTVIEGTNF